MDLVQNDYYPNWAACLWSVRKVQKKKFNILAAVLIVSLLINLAAVIAYQRMNTAQGRLEIGLENSYQRSFLELSDDVEQIKLQLAHVLVSASKEQTILGLANLWRSVYGAIN